MWEAIHSFSHSLIHSLALSRFFQPFAAIPTTLVDSISKFPCVHGAGRRQAAHGKQGRLFRPCVRSPCSWRNHRNGTENRTGPQTGGDIQQRPEGGQRVRQATSGGGKALGPQMWLSGAPEAGRQTKQDPGGRPANMASPGWCGVGTNCVVTEGAGEYVARIGEGGRVLGVFLIQWLS